MCGTCGCGSESSTTITKIGSHEHTHTHGHDHHHHGHDHHHHGHDHHHHHHHGHDHSHGTKTVVDLEADILQNNQILAARNRGYFEAKGMFVINLVSSPGSGKTTFLERTLSDLKEEHDFYVIEGDQQTANDANRIHALNVPVVQVNTGKGCHLESDMIHAAVKQLEPREKSFLMIENVGNLVCPSLFDLGENKRVVIISITEGEDKPIKYPTMFSTSDVCIINKMDLQPYLKADIEKIKDYARQVNPNLLFFEVSATTGEGMEGWYEWLLSNV